MNNIESTKSSLYHNPIGINDIVISGVGYHHPKEKISNEELVQTYNQYVDDYNKENDIQIKDKKITPLKAISADYIASVSGINSRYVRDKKNLLNVKKMWPHLKERPDNQLSMQAETCVIAAQEAMKTAEKDPASIDAIILASCHKQRDMPPVSVEVQNELKINGFAHDIGCACASSVYGIHSAVSMILAGTANVVLVVSPEIKSGQFSTRDPNSSFIFGEATSAVIVERRSTSTSKNNFKVCDVSLVTKFSNNIRNNRGAYNNCDPDNMLNRDKFFYQNGKGVYKEVTKLVSDLILNQINKYSIEPSAIKRFWLHQANIKINRKIVSNVINYKNFDISLSPEILSEFANVSSAGVIIAFAKHHEDLKVGDKCIMAAFGAGYSAGSILLEKVN